MFYGTKARSLSRGVREHILPMHSLTEIERFLIARLTKVKPWNLLVFATSCSLILSEILVVPFSIYFYGKVTFAMVMTAATEALIVSLILAYILIRLASELAVLASIVEFSDDAIIGQSLKGVVASWNSGAEKLFGYTKEEVTGRSASVLVPPDRSDENPVIIAKIINGEPVEHFETARVRKDGTVIDVSLTLSPIKDVSGKITGASAIYHDISERKQAEELLRSLSTLDSLTGIPNRRAFDAFLDEEWKRAQRGGYKISMMMIDVDQFKRYNDTNGHLKGDECLRKIAETLKQDAQRAGDLAARFGGEEFSVIFSMQEYQQAISFAKKICNDIEALKIPHEKSDISDYVTISIGIASMIPTQDISQVDLIKSADHALYKAKNEGRNRVVFAA
jgi:diguanylate cyclase (GGDEF)-like protein/PAS domain S-box-containing protein